MRRLLAGAEDFMATQPPVEPDITYFHRLRRIKLTHADAYPMLRRSGPLLGTVEAEVTQEKLRAVRRSILTSYVTFSAHVIAMAPAWRANRCAIARAHALRRLAAMTA